MVGRSKRSLLLLASILPTFLFFLLPSVSAQTSRRGATYSYDDEESEDAVTSGVSNDLTLLRGSSWNLQPLQVDSDHQSADASKYMGHIQKYLSKSLEVKLSGRQGKNGMRAVGRTPDGTKLRMFWRGHADRLVASDDLLKLSYDDAVKKTVPTCELEIQLPPVGKTPRGKKPLLPCVIYTISFERGQMDKEKLVPKHTVDAKFLLRGKERADINANKKKTYSKYGPPDESKVATGSRIGHARLTAPMKAGLVDPAWAKGRAIFRKGRPTGQV